MVPLSAVLTTVTRHPVGVLPGSSGWGRLERVTAKPPFTPVATPPPPVATSPSSQLAWVDREKLVETVLPADHGMWLRRQAELERIDRQLVALAAVPELDGGAVSDVSAALAPAQDRRPGMATEPQHHQRGRDPHWAGAVPDVVTRAVSHPALLPDSVVGGASRALRSSVTAR